VLVVLNVGRLWIYVRDRKILILKELLVRPQFLQLISEIKYKNKFCQICMNTGSPDSKDVA